MTLKKTGKEKQLLYLETGGEKTVERAKNSRESDSSEHDNWVIRGLCAAVEREDAFPALILCLPLSRGKQMKVVGKDTTASPPDARLKGLVDSNGRRGKGIRDLGSPA